MSDFRPNQNQPNHHDRGIHGQRVGGNVRGAGPVTGRAPRTQAPEARFDLRAWAGSRPELVILAAFLLVYLSWLGLHWIPGEPRSLQIAFLTPIDALAIWAAWRAANRSEGVRWLRGFWLVVMLAWTVELCADLSLAAYDIGLSDPTFPSVADAFFLCFYPLVLVALLRVPTAAGTRSQLLRTGLDTAAVVVGGAVLVWYFVLGHIVSEGAGSLLVTAVSSAYPIADVVLLAALAALLMRNSPIVMRAPLHLLAIGLLMMIAADTIYGHEQLHGSYVPGDLVDVLYVLTVVPFVLAAASQRRLRPGDERASAPGSAEPSLRASRLPLLGMAAGFGILLATQWHDRFFPDLSLLIFALVLAALMAARQYIAQRELLQLQGRVSTIIESVAEGIVTFSEAGEIIWANPAAEAAFAAEPGGLEGEPVDVLFADIGWLEIAPLVGVASGPDSAIGHRRKLNGRRGDGTAFPLELTVTDAVLDGERVLIGIGQDVSERDRTEAALTESEQRFRGIFDNAGVGIVFSGFKAGRPRVLDANSAFIEMLGYSLEELRGDDFSLITHPDDAADLAEIAEAVSSERDYIAREQRCVRRDGSFIWGSLTISILRDDAGEPRFAVGMLEDITRRKEAERVKDEFVSVVGHELRTPLTSIRGSLGLLEGGVVGELPPEATHMLATAVSNTDRLVRLINDILDLERIDSGRDNAQFGTVPAAVLIEQAVEVVEAFAAEAGVELRVAARPAEAIEVTANADRIVQALTNLLGNAIKFSPAGGIVTVTAERDRGRALFSVRDQGRGIPPDRIESIFERFSQVDASDAREKGGTGLGLSIARGIVEQHGGRIWAQSGGPGEGTAFFFTLPAADRDPERDVLAIEEGHALSGALAEAGGLG